MNEPHRHYWTQADDDAPWACRDCTETTETCTECGRYVTGDNGTPSSLLICPRCINHWRHTLDDIATAVSWHRWAAPSLIHATRYDRVIVTGSKTEEEQDASDKAEADRWTIRDLPRVLDSWQTAWCHARQETTELPAIDFMKGMVLWAAHNQEAAQWGDWKATMRRLLYVAKRDAGLLPKRMSTPCVYCGGIAVRTWAEKDLTPHADGLSEIVVCTGRGCGKTWENEGTYKRLATSHLHLLPDVRPDALVGSKQLTLVWPEIPSGTWRRWASDGEMPDPESWDEAGRPLYAVASLAPLVERRASETRRGPKAKTQESVAS